jgi:hypothetical protein
VRASDGLNLETCLVSKLPKNGGTTIMKMKCIELRDCVMAIDWIAYIIAPGFPK